jgi:exosome complex component RRP42
MDYCLGGIQAGVRADGRGLLDYRACVVESDTLLHANGSAIVVLGGLGRGNTTRVLGVVKAEVCKCEYHPSTTTVTNNNSADASTDSHATAARGSVQGTVTLSAWNGTPREKEEEEARLSEALGRILSSSPDFLKALVIPGSRGEYCWVLHVDVMVLEHGGSILDAATFVAHSALRNCVLPQVQAVEAEASNLQLELVQEHTVDAAALLQHLDERVRSLMPLSVTLTVIRSSTGEHIVVDPSLEEETCTSVAARITASVDMEGNVCALDVRCNNSSSQSVVYTAVSPSTLKRCIRAAARVGRELFRKLETVLAEEEATSMKEDNLVTERTSVGFM